ncbi:MAG: hypothetical protein LBO66_03405 [Deltaproteobacteria bacterium]|nr:hypothetical protein [Deltaproteobacteria bacterium]
MSVNPHKRFNTTGPCVPSEHYLSPALIRVPDIAKLIDEKYYFIIRSPRQSGKTTFLLALEDNINKGDKYYALYCSLEALDNVSNVETAMEKVVIQINDSLKESPSPNLRKLCFPEGALPQDDFTLIVRNTLNYICLNLDRDLVVLFDEADCLSPQALIPFLRQIRQGFNQRSKSAGAKFPRSLAIVGARDVRDCFTKEKRAEKAIDFNSLFNISEGALSVADFSIDEISALYGQLTAATGQEFAPQALERAWYWTEGQAWLVNALAKEIIETRLQGDYSRTITGEDFDQAAQSLLSREPVHLLSLKERVNEPKIRRVLEAVINGADSIPVEIPPADLKYAADLGILKKNALDDSAFRPANPIYWDMILRTISSSLHSALKNVTSPGFAQRWMDGEKLDMNGLLRAFQSYWRENAVKISLNYAMESRLATSVNDALDYYGYSTDKNPVFDDLRESVKKTFADMANEAVAHLAFIAFARWALKGQDDLTPWELALGMTGVDIPVNRRKRLYPLDIGLKGSLNREKMMERLENYMDRHGVSEGWLVVFNLDFNTPWSEKITWETLARRGKTIRGAGG